MPADDMPAAQMPALGSQRLHRDAAAAIGEPGKTLSTCGRKVMYWADTTNVAALFVRNPDWAVVFDMDAEAARQTRRRMADMVIRENMLLAGFHLPGAAIGSLANRGSGYDFTPLAG